MVEHMKAREPLADAEADRVYAETVEKARTWLNRIGLRDLDITFLNRRGQPPETHTTTPGENSTVVFEIATERHRNDALIYVYPDIIAQLDEDELNRDIVHELSHRLICWMRPDEEATKTQVLNEEKAANDVSRAIIHAYNYGYADGQDAAGARSPVENPYGITFNCGINDGDPQASEKVDAAIEAIQSRMADKVDSVILGIDLAAEQAQPEKTGIQAAVNMPTHIREVAQALGVPIWLIIEWNYTVDSPLGVTEPNKTTIEITYSKPALKIPSWADFKNWGGVREPRGEKLKGITTTGQRVYAPEWSEASGNPEAQEYMGVTKQEAARLESLIRRRRKVAREIQTLSEKINRRAYAPATAANTVTRTWIVRSRYSTASARSYAPTMPHLLTRSS